MQLFVIFIFGAVVFGSGAMLSPAWPTRQPRIGLAAALSLALIIAGTVFYAEAFGWNTLVIDYMFFALITAIVLGGTLSQAQARAEARGEVLLDADMGWPGPRDLAFYGLLALLIILPVLLLTVPAGSSGQVAGYLSLMARSGEGFNTLAPFHPEVSVLYPPGLHALTAYLSQQLKQTVTLVHMGIGAVIAFMSVLLAYDLGAELQDKRLGRAMAVMLVVGSGMPSLLLYGQFTALVGLFFTLALLVYALRYAREHHTADAAGAALVLCALLLTDPVMALVGLLVYVALLALLPLAWPDAQRPTPRVLLALLFGVPLLALLGCIPWLANNLHLLRAAPPDPYPRELAHLWALLAQHGLPAVAVALLGAFLVLRQGLYPHLRQAALLALLWLLLLVDFAALGIIERLLTLLLGPLVQQDALLLARQGPIIPYALLGGMGLLWLWDRLPTETLRRWLSTQAYMLFGGAALLAGGALLLLGPALGDLSRTVLNSDARMASEAEAAAMAWLRSETPPDARILNYPGSGEWTPMLAERDSVFFPLRPFYGDTTAIEEEQQAMLDFWMGYAGLDELRAAGITHILLPPAYIFRAERDISVLPGLELVYQQDDMRIYALTADE